MNLNKTAFLTGAILLCGATLVVAQEGYSLVYQLAIPATQDSYNSNPIPYTVDNSASFPAGSFNRVAYRVELSGSTDPTTRPNGFVYASFDAPAVFVDGGDLGVPSNGSNGSRIFTNTAVTNMNVFSDVAGITTGIGFPDGKLEFWPSNYTQGANGVFDYDDDGFGSSNGHGSMQVHNGGLAETLFGFSDWGGNSPGNPSEIGIGTNTGVGNPDWTFSDSGTIYTTRILSVYAIPEPTTLALGMISLGMLGMLRRRRTA